MLKENIKYLLSCRLCGDDNLNQFIDFGDVPLGNNLQETLIQSRKVDVYNLSVNRCNNCNHFQLGESISPKLLYATNYTYLSGIGKSFVKHMSEYCEWAISNTKIKKNNFVVDIGSNDGTCLSVFKKLGFEVCGVDPASIPAKIANENNIFTINKFFSRNVVDEIIKKFGKADFVTSQNVLAHIDNPKEVFKNIFDLLKDGAYFAFEVGYFKNVLEGGFFDTIYHEHLDYHHAKPLSSFLTKIGFEVIDFTTNKVQGGSLRVLVKKTPSPRISKSAQEFIKNEKKSVLFNSIFLNNWPFTIKQNMISLNEMINTSIINGKKIIAYGAPTKIVLLMKMADLNFKHIEFVVEDNKEKVGKYLPLSGIQIRSFLDITEDFEGEILITAWNFADDIIEKLKNRLKNNVNLVIPMPELRVKRI